MLQISASKFAVLKIGLQVLGDVCKNFVGVKSLIPVGMLVGKRVGGYKNGHEQSLLGYVGLAER